jgi:hypothetical protein
VSPRNVAGQFGALALIARPPSLHRWFGKRSSMTSLFAALCRLARLVHQAPPTFAGDVMVDQLRQLAAPLLRGSAALFLPMQHFLTLVIRH